MWRSVVIPRAPSPTLHLHSISDGIPTGIPTLKAAAARLVMHLTKMQPDPPRTMVSWSRMLGLRPLTKVQALCTTRCTNGQKVQR